MDKSFYKRFGLEVSLEEGKEKFINRVNEIILKKVENDTMRYTDLRYEGVIEHICCELGIDINLYKFNTPIGYVQYRGINRITNSDFKKTLKVLELLIEINTGYNKISIENEIKLILSKSIKRDNINLGININNGIIYPSGDNELDEEIIENSIDNIKGYKAKEYYNEALTKYLQGDKKGVNVSCFETLEKLSQELLGNEKGLKENKREIQKMFSETSIFNQYWSKIVDNLYNYFCDSRHTRNGTDNSNLCELETEAIIYQTGLIINLLIQKFNI